MRLSPKHILQRRSRAFISSAIKSSMGGDNLIWRYRFVSFSTTATRSSSERQMIHRTLGLAPFSANDEHLQAQLLENIRVSGYTSRSGKESSLTSDKACEPAVAAAQLNLRCANELDYPSTSKCDTGSPGTLNIRCWVLCRTQQGLHKLRSVLCFSRSFPTPSRDKGSRR